ncbi:MAG: hypothetical protein WD273_11500 [Trueperaceae bacterium]
MKRLLPIQLLLAVIMFATAQSYRVEGSGGPLTLAEDVATAAQAWNSLTGEATLEQEASAGTTIRFADPELMGPDVVSATVVRDTVMNDTVLNDTVSNDTAATAGPAGLDIWLHPELYRDYPQALLHELGLLLGVPAVVSASEEPEESVMTPALTGTGPDAPTEGDIEALRAGQERISGDIDGDGRVDLSDLAELGRAYGQRGVNLVADLDDDGVVGAGDVELLRENYIFTAPEPPTTGETDATETAPGVEESDESEESAE